eukprot:2840842-Pleurochrysis_carterae.AAC.3
METKTAGSGARTTVGPGARTTSGPGARTTATTCARTTATTYARRGGARMDNDEGEDRYDGGEDDGLAFIYGRPG